MKSNKEIAFENYVDTILTADEEAPEPTCPFPCNNGECYVNRRAPGEGCVDCEWAKKSYEKKIDDLLHALHLEEPGRGARIFCVNCGAMRGVTFRKWHNVYICSMCYKYLNIIGEDAFIENLQKEAAYKETASQAVEDKEDAEQDFGE